MSAAGGFVGRTDELRLLGEALTAARSGSSRVVVVEGEPGAGKSTLLARFVAGLTAAGVVEVSGGESETLLAYGVVDQLDPDTVTPAAADPMVVGARLLDRVARLQAADRAAVVIVDDLQWTDRASSRALLFALRRLRTDRALVVVSTRRHELTDPGWARFVAGDARVSRIRLDGLRTGDLIDLASRLGRGVLSERGAAHLVAHTGGNALYSRALLDEITVPELNAAGPGGLPVPRELSAIILARVAALPPTTQALLAAAAVLGQHTPVSTAVAVAGTGDARGDLDAAAAVGVLTRDAGRAHLRFAHPLFRAAVYADLNPDARRRLHDRAAGLSTGRPRLAHRVAAAPGPDEALAVELDSFGHAAAAAGDAAAAAWALEQAGALSQDQADRDRRLLDTAVVLLDAADTPAAARVLALIEVDGARRDALLGLLGVFTASPTTERRLRGAWSVHDPSTERDVGARAATSLTNWLLISGRAEEALEWADRAVGATDAGTPLRAMAATAQAYALAAAGRAAEGLAVLGFLPAAANEVPLVVTDALIMRGILRVCDDDLPGAVADLGAAAGRLRAGVPSTYPGPCLAYLSDAHFRSGHWDAAVVNTDAATALAHDGGRPLDLARAHAQAAFVPAARGQWAAAQAHVEAARVAAEEFPLAFAVAAAAGAGAAFASARGDLPGVLAAVEAVRTLGSPAAGGHPGMFGWRPSEVDALIGLGRLDEARAALDEFDAAIPRTGPASATLASAALALARCRGNLAAAHGDQPAAQAAFHRAHLIGDGVAMPFELALLDLDDGRRLARAGRHPEAVTRLEAARRRFARLGADPYVRSCDGELAAAQTAAAARTAEPVAGLSPAELAVARLAGAGRTNREIAAELYLSVKTVEYHLHNIFMKLDITSRRGLPALLR